MTRSVFLAGVALAFALHRTGWTQSNFFRCSLDLLSLILAFLGVPLVLCS